MNESQYKTLLEISNKGTLSQRDLAKKIGLSLGKINYTVNALLEKGYIKASRFKNSKNKMAYRYILTPSGVSIKITQTYQFLERKTREYEQLKAEIDALRAEADRQKQKESHVTE
jgi:EPS-associated MarR family transcriptional regulator